MLELLRCYRKIKALLYEGHIYGSVLSRPNSSHIVAIHPKNGVQVAQIQHFCFYELKGFSHGLPSKGISIFVKWYEPHPENCFLSTSVFVCCKYHSETSFILLTDILSRAAICIRSQLVQKLFYVLFLWSMITFNFYHPLCIWFWIQI